MLYKHGMQLSARFPETKPDNDRLAKKLKHVLKETQRLGDSAPPPISDDSLVKKTLEKVLDVLHVNNLKKPYTYKFTPAGPDMRRLERFKFVSELKKDIRMAAENKLLKEVGAPVATILTLICDYSHRITDQEARSCLLNAFECECRRNVERVLDRNPTFEEGINDLVRNYSTEKTLAQREREYLKSRLTYDDVKPGLLAIYHGVAATHPDWAEKDISQTAVLTALQKLPGDIMTSLQRWLAIERQQIGRAHV